MIDILIGSVRHFSLYIFENMPVKEPHYQISPVLLAATAMNGRMMKAAVLGRCQTGYSHGVAVFLSCGNTSQFSYVHACTNPCFTQSMSLVTSVIKPWLSLDADLIIQTSWESETLPISLHSGSRQTLNYPDYLRGWDSTEFIKLWLSLDAKLSRLPERLRLYWVH